LDQCGEYNRYMRGLIAWLGFRQTSIQYARRPRTAGVSKAPFWELVFFVFNAITSFSLRPLRLFTLFGFGVVVISVMAAFVYAFLSLMGSPPRGITTLIVLATCSESAEQPRHRHPRRVPRAHLRRGQEAALYVARSGHPRARLRRSDKLSPARSLHDDERPTSPGLRRSQAKR
jgi:hypothetical protein